jgi:hypothetical protein
LDWLFTDEMAGGATLIHILYNESSFANRSMSDMGNAQKIAMLGERPTLGE